MDFQIVDENVWLFFCFGVFLLSILFFAVFYYALYKKSSQNFLFGRDIARTQLDFFSNNSALLINRLEAEIEALKDLDDMVGSGATLRGLSESKEDRKLSAGHHYRIESRYGPGPYGVGGTYYEVIIFNIAGELISRRPVGNDEGLGKKGWLRLSKSLIKKKRQKIKNTETRMLTLTDDFPDIWSFWDFLYFSIITQTTVGYGDILPNSTIVRALVVSQVLTSYLILVVLINLLLIK